MYKLNYSKIVSKLLFLVSRVVIPIQVLIYKYYYWSAVRKWPHLREEILSCATYPRLLQFLGVIITRHPEGWISVDVRKEKK